jgi:NAD(P)-dependent dehydrogenase (short-subunit alcohol dehydrogenase family)
MQKRTWFITGISSGFGREMTKQLLARGDRVAGTVRDLAAMAELAPHEDNLWLAELDLVDTPSIRVAVDRAFADLKVIDVVVSNAGYGLMGATEEMSDAQVMHQLDTNLLGSIQVIRSALPHLRRQGGGRILQISSFGGQAALPGGSMYHATKWGIEGFLDGVSREVKPFGIECTIVEPGGARTDFRTRSAQLPANRIAAYDASPAIHVRKIFEGKAALSPGDPVKMVELMIASVDQSPAPLRLAMGKDAYTMMHAQLTERLAALEAQQDLALSTDLPA